MATRAERFKSEQAKEHARAHAQAAAPATASNGVGKNGKTAKNGANKKTKDHIKSATPLTSREMLLNMSPSVRHQRRT
jgi:hypothetical protein